LTWSYKAQLDVVLQPEMNLMVPGSQGSHDTRRKFKVNNVDRVDFIPQFYILAFALRSVVRESSGNDSAMSYLKRSIVKAPLGDAAEPPNRRLLPQR